MIAACSQNPITGRKQLTLLPEDQMNSMALTEYQSFLTENKTKVVTTGTNVDLVKKVGTRIATAVNAYMIQIGLAEKMKSYSWEFNVVEDPIANAWRKSSGLHWLAANYTNRSRFGCGDGSRNIACYCQPR